MLAAREEAVMARMCEVEGCLNPAAGKGRMCWAHYKQRSRTGILRPVNQRPSEAARARLLEAVHALADADSEDDPAYARAECAFWEAFREASRVADAVVALSNRPRILRRR